MFFFLVCEQILNTFCQTKEYFLHPEHHIQADGESVEVCMNLIKTLKESGHCSSPGQDDHRQTGRGAGYVYICVYVRTRVGGSRRVYYG